MFSASNEIITIQGTNQPKENYTVVSRLTHYRQQFQVRHFGIKYVNSGEEHYSIHGHRFTVKKGEYLLNSYNREGEVCIESDQEVNGICINLTPTLIAEAAASFIRPDTAQPDLELDKFFGAAYFTDFKFSCKETHAGGLLEKIATSLATGKLQPADFDDEFYFSFALSVVKDYSLVIQQLHQIPGIKFGTKKWLLQKLANGKEYLDENFTSDLSVAQAAKHAGIAQFHFYRLYKAVYGLSPWQYILHRRLAFARSLLQTQGVGIGEAALLSGFADVYSFSKAFKKRYSYPPSKLQRLI